VRHGIALRQADLRPDATYALRFPGERRAPGHSCVRAFPEAFESIAIGWATRFYNPTTHQWSIYWANSKNAAMDPSPQVGQFQDGRGEFYGTDTLDGKAIYVRFVWTNTTSAAPHFEQSFSADGGKTWEVNWITEQQRVTKKAD
jgi:hypothetical protein